ncbi:PREDICTED: translation initiation factor IF-2-like, partial [Chinchilla lanigera]|uniref:translation initiation factor IF-2-like n=1 Tax=Chinchilla lanigera TaxID=34839 RepID=UPI0006968E2B
MTASRRATLRSSAAREAERTEVPAAPAAAALTPRSWFLTCQGLEGKTGDFMERRRPVFPIQLPAVPWLQAASPSRLGEEAREPAQPCRLKSRLGITSCPTCVAGKARRVLSHFCWGPGGWGPARAPSPSSTRAARRRQAGAAAEHRRPRAPAAPSEGAEAQPPLRAPAPGRPGSRALLASTLRGRRRGLRALHSRWALARTASSLPTCPQLRRASRRAPPGPPTARRECSPLGLPARSAILPRAAQAGASPSAQRPLRSRGSAARPPGDFPRRPATFPTAPPPLRLPARPPPVPSPEANRAGKR